MPLPYFHLKVMCKKREAYFLGAYMVFTYLDNVIVLFLHTHAHLVMKYTE